MLYQLETAAGFRSAVLSEFAPVKLTSQGKIKQHHCKKIIDMYLFKMKFGDQATTVPEYKCWKDSAGTSQGMELFGSGLHLMYHFIMFTKIKRFYMPLRHS